MQGHGALHDRFQPSGAGHRDTITIEERFLTEPCEEGILGMIYCRETGHNDEIGGAGG